MLENLKKYINFYFQYRSGDILSPNLKPVEALKVEVDCLINQIDQKQFSAKMI